MFQKMLKVFFKSGKNIQITKESRFFNINIYQKLLSFLKRIRVEK